MPERREKFRMNRKVVVVVGGVGSTPGVTGTASETRERKKEEG